MTRKHQLELPGHVVAKIEKVLGIPPSELPQHDLVSLIEELCDTALMFDRGEPCAGQTAQEEPSNEGDDTSPHREAP